MALEGFLVAYPITAGGKAPKQIAIAWHAIRSIIPHPTEPNWVIVEMIRSGSFTLSVAFERIFSEEKQ